MAISPWAPGASSPLNKFSTPTFRYNGLLPDPPYRNDRYPDPSDPDKWLDDVSPIPLNSAIALDFPTLHYGFGMWFPKAESRKYFVPVTDPFPNQPPDPNYKPGFKMLVGVRGFGIMNWTDLHGLMQDDVINLWTKFASSAEARAGQIPVYRISSMEEVFLKKRNATYWKIVFDFIAWMQRNPALFGPSLIDLTKAQSTAALEIPDRSPARSAAIDQIHQERLEQSRQPQKSLDSRYNVTHTSADTKASTTVSTPRGQFDPNLDDELPF